MELHEAIRRRAMVRSFSTAPVDPDVVRPDPPGDALRSPTAGNTGGTAWVVLEGPEETGRYWSSDDRRRPGDDRNTERFEGLRRAPVVLLAYASPDAYVARYAEPDKAGSGLGRRRRRWPVPYWHGDAAFGVMAVLLGAVDAGLGACILGAFRGRGALARDSAVPAGWLPFCAVVLGHPDGQDRRSPSLEHVTPGPAARIHWGTW